MNIQDDKIRDALENLGKKVDESPTFNQREHDSQSRLRITTLFLKAYFWLIGGSFVFSAIYNFGAALLNGHIAQANPIKYLDVSNTVSIITTTLSSGVGFVIGYYFKNKEEKD